NSSRTSRTLREIKTTTYIWDDWNIIREVVREGDSVAVTDNVWGLDLDGTLQGAGGVGGLLAVVRDDGVFLPTYDANGNISEYVSTNGEIVAHYDYSPFGEPLVSSGPLAATFTHQFSTKPHCSVTGFSEYQMRKYRPEIGRWMSRDPIEEIGGENLYGFCGNSAITTSDIRGQGFWQEKDMCKCNQWLTEAVKDLKWLLSLPNCPCKLAFDKSNRPIRPKGWPSMDNPADQTYHPGARYCIRSSPVGHARQQCCYDEKGALITWGGGAGTPDKESDLFKHKANDVNPYYICGKSWKLYNFARPPNNGNNCAENPLNPPHGPGF
ncbi:MAG: hypothetical protein IKJ45_02345, partial [Kiritimatiellae bacterium]|nr:hypothetical protein [Kiritimatiellia bacterium]